MLIFIYNPFQKSSNKKFTINLMKIIFIIFTKFYLKINKYKNKINFPMESSTLMIY